MITQDKAKEIVQFCYKVLFLLADPPINFDKIMKQNKKGKLKDNWFYDHSMSIEAQDDVIKRVAKIYSLKPYERKRLETEIHLGCSPKAIFPDAEKN